MFRRTPPQQSLFTVENRMGSEKRARLEKSWAHAFRQDALPLIDEELLRRYFDEDNGRPNKSIRMIVGVLLLKEVNDLTDREALERLEWDASWHYALEVLPEDAHTCQKTLHNFRAKLLSDDKGAGLFEATASRIIVAAKLRTMRQRLDSTHTVSNIKILTRLGLFTQTITKFLEALRIEHPGLCRRIDRELRERYLDREGYFSDARGSEAPRRLEEAALDLYALVMQFAKLGKVSSMSQYRLIKRLYEDQCQPPECDSPVAIKLLEKPLSSSLQSPSDPDVTYGHKGKGYEVQIAETCDEENGFQVITAVHVNHANESDQQAVIPMIEQVERTTGAAPEQLFTDAGYASGDNLVAAADRGTDLQAPIGTSGSVEHFPVHQFRTNEEKTEVLRCPNGQVPIEHRPSKNGRTILATFSATACETCPLAALCPTEPRKDVRVLAFNRATLAVAERRIEQTTSDFKEQYKIRSGIEATNSEFKRCHGLRKLRVRRFARVALSVRLKAIAVNIKRYVAHITDSMAASRAVEATCAC